jgi:preprotein translocase subunit SecE
MEDKYELKCQSTDNEQYLNDKKGQVLVSEKKESQKTKYTFKQLSSNIFFKVLLILFVLMILYFLLDVLITKYMKKIVMKGGGLSNTKKR